MEHLGLIPGISHEGELRGRLGSICCMFNFDGDEFNNSGFDKRSEFYMKFVRDIPYDT